MRDIFYRALFSLALLFFAPIVVFAVSSTNYELEIDPDTTAFQRTSSSSFELESAFEPVVGSTSSNTFTLEHGSAFPWLCGDGFIDPGETCETGGAGDLNGQSCTSLGYNQGTLSCAANCTFDISMCSNAAAVFTPSSGQTSFHSSLKDQTTYASLFLFFGTKSASTRQIFVNGSTKDVVYPTSTSWQVWVVLALGPNDFVLSDSEDLAHAQSFSITRLITADSTGDGVVDDYDLSRLVRAWGSSDSHADLNEDGVVDDYDLSLLTARWLVAI
ncbi:MAG: dockerin type I domain-containing protein [Candidatus Uhrbacteria bacterium]|nr:dockerin type I domain-containing protein [Candidatus Uhrbacteria bacterium]